MLQTTIPGKLIISGEHAVVYGSPALAAAIDRYIHIRLTPIKTHHIEFSVAEYHAPLIRLSFDEFWQQVDALQSRYQDFLHGTRLVTEITDHLYDLPLYALGLFLRHIGEDLRHGLKFTISGDLPMGYGLGSSAAVVVGILRISSLFFNRSFAPADLQPLAVQVENLQHGQSSGLDTSVCLYEGVVLYSKNSISRRTLTPWTAYLVNSGQPLSSTGECVAHVKQQEFGKELWERFTQVTTACDQALQEHNTQKLHDAIAENHQLLCSIGVVPMRIQDFAAKIAEYGAATKICGAGSVRGDNAGYLLIALNEDEPHNLANIEAVAHQFGFTLEHVHLGVTPNKH